MKVTFKRFCLYTFTFFIFILVAFCCFLLYETKDEIHANSDNVDEIFQKIYDGDRMAGFAVSIFTPDSVLFMNGYGYRDVRQKLPFTAKTQQYLASISKTIVGVSILQANQLGLIDLDQEIEEILPYDIRNPSFPDHSITIRQLATHTSSLEYNEEFVESLYIQDDLKSESLGDVLDSYFEKKKFGEVAFIESKPGSTYNYSNIGIGLLAYIIELTSGMTFREFSKRHVFDQVGLKDVDWYIDDAINPQAKYYSLNENVLTEVDSMGVQLYPCRDLNANIEELTHLCQNFMGYNEKLMSDLSFQEMFRPQLSNSIQNLEDDNVGIIWQIDSNQYGNYYRLTGHSGSDTGINSMMYFDPKIQLGYIFIGNTGQSEQNRVHHILAFKTLLSFGNHFKKENASSFGEKAKFIMYNYYSRIRAFFM
ncbi:MAG: serine hydrolase domain-containing protein [Bacteroidota bacterium]